VRARRHRAGSALFAPLVLLGVSSLLPATSQASDDWPSSVGDSLQPEGPRLFLNLPPHLLPSPASGSLEALELTQIPLGRATRGSVDLAAAMSGTTLQLDLTNRARSFSVNLILQPRQAVMVLRFDPIPSRVR
jgi:hypothetical protein